MKRVVFMILGVGALCYGLFWLTQTVTFVMRAESAPGTVVRLIEGRGRRGRTMYQPVVSFQTQPGAAVSFTGAVASSGMGSYNVGDRVRVLYNPAHPAEATIASFTDVWLFPLALLVLGFAFASTGHRLRTNVS